MISRFSRLVLGAVVLGGLALGGGVARAEGSLVGAVAGKPYVVTVAPVSGAKGQPVKAQVVIRPAAGYHMNEEFPTTLKLSPTAGVAFSKAALAKQDAVMSKQECRFDVQMTGSEAGKKSVTGSLSFAVCTETTCDPQKTSVTIELTVK